MSSIYLFQKNIPGHLISINASIKSIKITAKAGAAQLPIYSYTFILHAHLIIHQICISIYKSNFKSSLKSAVCRSGNTDVIRYLSINLLTVEIKPIYC